MPLQLVDLTDPEGRPLAAEWLAPAEAVHRQLRPTLPAGAAYGETMRRLFDGGARMRLAVAEDAVQGLAVWRLLENTAYGRFVYVDDLVTDAARRSTGIGRALLRSLESTARTLGCSQLVLDSGTQRHRAHAFYFGQGLTVSSFHFVRPL